MSIKAVVFDFIETLVHTKVDHELCLRRLVETLREDGLVFSSDDFLLNYSSAVHKYSYLREVTCREVKNEIWVSEALMALGYSLVPEDDLVQRAVDAYFQPYIDTLSLSTETLSMLCKIHRRFSTGLISNFTVGRVIHQSLKRLGLTKLLDHVMVSEEAVWRKPHPSIFKEMLDVLDAKPEETVFIGDSLVHDAYGAKYSGLNAILITGGPNAVVEGHKILCFDTKRMEPDFRVASINELPVVLSELCER
jgi:putative hydrolase of the HAD superfamily